MRVIFFQRKPRADFNFSVENLFDQVRKYFPDKIQCEVKVLSYLSNGFIRRLAISLEAALSQRDINHVTGDVNFITIFLSRKRTVLTLLDVGFMRHPNPIARLILKWFWIILPVKRAGIVTAISQATKYEILKYVAVDPDKIRVIYVPIISDFISVAKNFNKLKPRILQIGTRSNKNVIRLVMALEGISCHLDIVGTIESELAEALALYKIDFSNSKSLTNAEMVRKYAESDIVSFVSTYEGFGMPIVEANTVGRVVVTSNILSMPEIAGNAAHLVDPLDVFAIRQGIMKVINDDSYRETLILNGFQNSKRFNAVTISSQYALVYEELFKHIG